MRRSDNSYWIVLIILGALCLFPLDLPSSFSIDASVDPRFTQIPYQIGDWTGTDSQIDQRTIEILETKNILSRTYENPQKETIHLLLVGSNKDRRVAHPPEVCYTSSGYDIVSSRNDDLIVSGSTLPVKRFTAQEQNNPSRKEQVLYLYKVGQKFTRNYYAQQLQFAADSLKRQNSQVWLIRIAGSSDQAFTEFLSEILPHLS